LLVFIHPLPVFFAPSSIIFFAIFACRFCSVLTVFYTPLLVFFYPLPVFLHHFPFQMILMTPVGIPEHLPSRVLLSKGITPNRKQGALGNKKKG